MAVASRIAAALLAAGVRAGERAAEALAARVAQTVEAEQPQATAVVATDVPAAGRGRRIWLRDAVKAAAIAAAVELARQLAARQLPGARP